MATKSIRQQIIDEIDKRLKTIRVSAGYETEAGKYVFEWRDRPMEEGELPGIIYRDLSDPITTDSKTTHIHNLNLEVELFASGSDVPTTIRKMIADVNKAIGTDERWGALAIETIPDSEDMVTEEGSKRLMSAIVRVNISFHTGYFKPYTQ